jgi:L-aminopeptidase/D-esterase-like protein
LLRGVLTVAVRRPVDFAEVRGLSVGQAESPEGTTGVTAIVFDAPAATVVDVRGGASATYDTASLTLDATFGRRWALFLAGGSLFGLDAARGVRARLLETGAGSRVFSSPVPLVQISGAALFDLPEKGGPPDYLPLGYEAARRASREPVAVGRVGAGAGATVGKYLGRGRSMHGGLGASATRLVGGGSVGVLVAINAVGAIRDPRTGRWVAGARGPRGIVPPDPNRPLRAHGGSTSLTVLATDLSIDRPTLYRAMAIVHAGLAAAVFPFHTATDGDVLFGASTGPAGPPRVERRRGEIADQIGSVGAGLAVDAVLRAAMAANRRN